MKKSAKGSRTTRMAIQAESMSIRPHVHKGMTCSRCEATDCAIVPNVDPAFTALQGVGASQHAMLCSNQCAGPWTCGGCEDRQDGKDSISARWHSTWCEVAHPGVRDKWEKTHDRELMRLAFLVAARGEFLPAFLMDGLFPGFTHADPPSFAAFKQRAVSR